MKLQGTIFLSIFYKVSRHEHPDSRTAVGPAEREAVSRPGAWQDPTTSGFERMTTC